MSIPFTSPKLRELDALTQGERSAILKEYAVSSGGRRAVRVAKLLMFAAIGFALLGFITPGLLDPAPSGRSMVNSIVVFFWCSSGIAVILALTLYRIMAQRALRAIIVARRSNSLV